MPEVLVKDNEGSAIYSYSSTATALVLSDKATNTYKLNADMVIVRNIVWLTSVAKLRCSVGGRSYHVYTGTGYYEL